MNDNDESDLSARFDAYICSCIKHISMNYDRDEKRKWYNNIIFFDDIPELENICITDTTEKMFEKTKEFQVDGIHIEVCGEKIISALEQLPEELRSIILLYYFERKSDESIAKLMKKIQRTVNNRRKKALDMLKEILSLYDEDE